MNKHNIKKGMRVRVKHNLDATEDEWTLDGDGIMLTMREKAYKVHEIDFHKNGITLYDHDNDEYWIFCPEDLTIMELKKPHPPVMFDPTNL